MRSYRLRITQGSKAGIVIVVQCLALLVFGSSFAEEPGALRTSPPLEGNNIYLIELPLKSFRVVTTTTLPCRVYVKRSTSGEYKHFLTNPDGKFNCPEQYLLSGSIIRGDRLGGIKDRFYTLSPDSRYLRSDQAAEIYSCRKDSALRREHVVTPQNDIEIDDDRRLGKILSARSNMKSKNSFGMEMAWIPASISSGTSDELERVESVAKDGNREPFWLSVTEVTESQWKTVMKSAPWERLPHFKYSKDETVEFPAVNISWDDANAFCLQISKSEGRTYRLPTEAEWEHACRAGTTTVYYCGDDVDELTGYAWIDRNSRSQLHPHGVKQLQANQLELHDMMGNVWEWCSDEFEFADNPKRTTSTHTLKCTHRVLRGGSWGNNSHFCRSSIRSSDAPTRRDRFYGFRVLCETE